MWRKTMRAVSNGPTVLHTYIVRICCEFMLLHVDRVVCTVQYVQTRPPSIDFGYFIIVLCIMSNGLRVVVHKFRQWLYGARQYEQRRTSYVPQLKAFHGWFSCHCMKWNAIRSANDILQQKQPILWLRACSPNNRSLPR